MVGMLVILPIGVERCLFGVFITGALKRQGKATAFLRCVSSRIVVLINHASPYFIPKFAKNNSPRHLRTILKVGEMMVLRWFVEVWL